jgi:oligopeptide transport system ATP-binding protein
MDGWSASDVSSPSSVDFVSGGGGQPPLLAVEDLIVEFVGSRRSLRAVDKVSFELSQGSSLGIVGESGSGKSLTARAIMGLLPRNAARLGRIRFEGMEIDAAAEDQMRTLRGRSIAMIFQDPLSCLNPVLTIGTQIAETFRFHRQWPWRQCRVEAVRLMDRVGIPSAAQRAKDYPHQFSGGMRQRAMMAMAIALKPRILIADEPTTALDVTVQAQILDLLQQLRSEEGMAIVIISHDLGVVAELAERVAVMYAGRVMEIGGVNSVFHLPSHPYTHGLLEATPRLDRAPTEVKTMSGNPPILTSIPDGCRFHTRCAFAQLRCLSDDPALLLTGPDVSSACHFSSASRWVQPR